jgi:hypothetical protein
MGRLVVKYEYTTKTAEQTVINAFVYIYIEGILGSSLDQAYRGKTARKKMPLQITQARKIEGDKFDNAKAMHIDVTVITDEDAITKNTSDVPFFALEKSDRKLARLLTMDQNTSRERPLSRTNVIEQVKALRDNAFWESLGKEGASRMTKADRAKALLTENTTVEITMPIIGDIPEYKMKVVLAHPNNRVLVELSDANIEYFQNVVDKQLSDDNIKNRYGRGFDNKGRTGVSALYRDDGSVKALVVKRKPASGGDGDGDGVLPKVASKYIKVDGELEDATEKAFSSLSGELEPERESSLAGDSASDEGEREPESPLHGESPDSM